MAIVAEGPRGRVYLAPDVRHVEAANVPKPEKWVPQGALPEKALGFRVQLYGNTEYCDLFTNRQLTTLATFSDLVEELKKEVERDAITAGMNADNTSLGEGGLGACAYAQAIGVYLAFVIDKLADRGSANCSLDVNRESIRNTFGRPALPMVWDFAETNPFCNSSGSIDNMLTWVTKVLPNFPLDSLPGRVRQQNATEEINLSDIMISTDPPYYDNIGYADLSDFFYVWLRQLLQNIYPEEFRAPLVPKREELIADPGRFDGKQKEARKFFEDGMLEAFKKMRAAACDDVPVTVYYAFKQSEMELDAVDAKKSSPGWETMLTAVLRAGFAITGTWPMQTELANRTRGLASNALASSIVLVCRKRPDDAPVCSRRDFVKALRRELPDALEKLKQGNLAPVDLAQSAIGPGMAIFSRYSQVLDANGEATTVRGALQIINRELDAFLNGQNDDIDSLSRFCVELYDQSGFDDVPFGDADLLARAKNVSVAELGERGALYAKKGVVRLLKRDEIEIYGPHNGVVWSLTQRLARALEQDGVAGCVKVVAQVGGASAENARALAYRLYALADDKGWTQEACAYNNLVVDWPKIQALASQNSEETGRSERSLFDGVDGVDG